MKLIRTILWTATCIISSAANASETEVIDEALYIVPSLTYQFLDNDGHINDLAALGINLGYRLNPQWSFELGVKFGKSESSFGDDADMLSWQADALYNFQPQGNWQPYAVASLMALSFDVDKTRVETSTGLGVGSYYRINDNLRLRTDVRGYYSYTDNLVDSAINLGIEYTFGSKPKKTFKAKTTVTTATVVAAPAPKLFTFAVHFQTEKAQLLPEYKEHVEDLITVLRENPKAHIIIEGDTDNTGSDAFNLHLSQERADAVKYMLVTDYGIHKKRISIDAEGESKPVADNNTETGRAENRRAVVKVRVNHE